VSYIFRLYNRIKKIPIITIPPPIILVYRILLISEYTHSGILVRNPNIMMEIPNIIIKPYVSQGFISNYLNDLSFNIWNKIQSFKVSDIFVKTMGSCLSRMICLSNFLSRQLPTYITSGLVK